MSVCYTSSLFSYFAVSLCVLRIDATPYQRGPSARTSAFRSEYFVPMVLIGPLITHIPDDRSARTSHFFSCPIA